MTYRFPPKSIVMCLFLNIVLAFTQVVHASGYGIKFVQSNKTITFEGNISEYEWLLNYNDNQFCAKLKTIHIKEGSIMIGKYMGFPKTDNYLLSTEDMNKNRIQGDSIIICIDQNENPGSLKIQNTLHLTTSNYVHEFEISDFKFIHDSNIQVNSIKKDYLPNGPSILLRLSNDTNGLKYSNCSICVNNSNNWTIQSETDWKNVGSDTWRGYFRYFSVNPNQRDRHGVIYSDVFKQFQLILPPPEMPEKETGISVYAKSTEKPGKLEFFVHHKPDQSTYFPYCIPFKKKHFRFKNKSDNIKKIQYDHRKDSRFSPRPSILLIIEGQEVSISKNYQNRSSQRYSTQKTSSDIWNQIDISTFDNNEFEVMSDIYEHNISKGFYCTLQDFSFDRSRIKYLSMSNWHNRYERKLVYDQNDPFNSTFYIQLISEHRNNHRKEFFIIKAFDHPLDLIHATKKIHHFNHIKFADQKNWRIPTIGELTQIFQLQKYQESHPNLIKSFMPKYTHADKISFWTSTFQNRKKRILWTVRFRFNHAYVTQAYMKMDYDLTYHLSSNSNSKAYLLPVAEP